LAYIQGEARGPQALFPSTLDELIPADHVCRVIEALVAKLDVAALGFVRAEPGETGRPGYDPRDRRKLYRYGSLQPVRSSRRLEAECRRNVEGRWRLGRRMPDYKSIAEFRRLQHEAMTAAGAEWVRRARQVGWVQGEWVASEGSKFRAVSSAPAVREREAVQRYLDQWEKADPQDEVTMDERALAAALEKLNNDPEPEARFMRRTNGYAPAYNVQTAVDAEHAIMVAQQVTTEAADNRSLLPMAKAAKQALGTPVTLPVVADAGYSNGEQAEPCESQGIVPHGPSNRAIHHQGDGTRFDRRLFVYDEKTDPFRCPAGQILNRKQLSCKDRCVMYAAEAQVCGARAMKNRCTSTPRRWITRHRHEGALQRMNQRATAQRMRLRRCTVERPFAVLKHVILGNARFLLRGRDGAQTEISLATLAYNLKTMFHALGGYKLRSALAN